MSSERVTNKEARAGSESMSELAVPASESERRRCPKCGNDEVLDGHHPACPTREPDASRPARAVSEQERTDWSKLVKLSERWHKNIQVFGEHNGSYLVCVKELDDALAALAAREQTPVRRPEGE